MRRFLLFVALSGCMYQDVPTTAECCAHKCESIECSAEQFDGQQNGNACANDKACALLCETQSNE